MNQAVYVPTNIIPMKQIFPGDNPTVVAARVAPLTPIEYTPGATFDTKMATINASLRGLDRGIALPLLLDLARKPSFFTITPFRPWTTCSIHLAGQPPHTRSS